MENFVNSAQELLENKKYSELLNFADDEIKHNQENVRAYEYKVKTLFFNELDKETEYYNSSKNNEDYTIANAGVYKQISELCDYRVDKITDILTSGKSIHLIMQSIYAYTTYFFKCFSLFYPSNTSFYNSFSYSVN